MTFCGVFDGHGPHGHLVARKVRDTLPLKLLSLLKSCQTKEFGSNVTCCNVDPKSDGADLEKDDSIEDKISSLWRDAFLKSYKAMDKELRSHPNLDCFCSGSTAVTIVKQVGCPHFSAFVIICITFRYLFWSSILYMITRVQIYSWETLGILEQLWDPRTAMMIW